MFGILLALAITALPRVPTEAERVLSLDGEWNFSLFSSETNALPLAQGKIDVPSSWELRGYGRPLYDEKVSGEVGLYRRTFEVPRGWDAASRLYLRFDGVQFGAAVRVNGRIAGEFTSSFNAHVLDVTGLVRRDGRNDLEVRTHGNPKGASFDTNDDWTLHGIHRSVRLFALPKVHVRDWRVSTRVDGATARVTVDYVVSGGDCDAQVSLFAPDGRKIACSERRPCVEGSLSDIGQVAKRVTFAVTNASLWTAETPCLHTLEIALPLQTVREKVGLREVSWNATSLMVNGRPVELRGVNHHDISPFNGRAVTAAEQRRDVELARNANCNFIRTSHYPPSEALLDACDELGVYVMDEVPFGHGNRFLEDASYGPLLLERARLTLERDANRACVVAWSVGNENPITDITVAAADLVRKLDPTRPRCFPLQPNYFADRFAEKGLKDCGDMLNWHYPLICGTPRELHDNWFSKFDRPFLSGEFAHANGLDHGALETYVDMMRSEPAYVGGAVWMFSDQGILRRAGDLSAEELKHCTWLDGERVFDSHAHQGSDGIVYSDRTPQIDYFETKKTFSPIVLGDIGAASGSGGGIRWSVPVENHYDFLSLDKAVAGSWRIVSSRGCEALGRLSIPPVPPRGRGVVVVDARVDCLPDVPVVWLEASFADVRDGHEIYRRTYPLSADVREPFAPKKGDVAAEKFGETVKSQAYAFSFSRERGEARFEDADGRVLFKGALLVRVDRRPSLTKDCSMAKRNPWQPHVMKPSGLSVVRFDGFALELEAVYVPSNSVARSNATLRGRWTFTFLPDRMKVAYSLVQSCSREVFEMGVAIPLAEGAARFDWVGLGPYEAYPGSSNLSDFGIWSLYRRDLYFPGNRREVRAVRVSSSDGSGIVVMPDGESGDFAFERLPCGGLVLGVNAVVSCRACRFMLPPGVRTIGAGEEVRGGFIVVPSAALPAAAQHSVFGDRSDPKPFAPFAKTYDE